MEKKAQTLHRRCNPQADRRVDEFVDHTNKLTPTTCCGEIF